MTGLLKHLAYFGPERKPAALAFSPGLNVICGASETGKSFVVESIDFMLGQQNPVRDIPEREGYDRARLVIESAGWPPLTLDRSIEGGHFRAYEEVVTDGDAHNRAKKSAVATQRGPSGHVVICSSWACGPDLQSRSQKYHRHAFLEFS